MKLHHDIIAVLTFWCLYTPMSLVYWYETSQRANLLFVLSVGIIAVLLYLIVTLAISRPKKESKLIKEPILIESKNIEIVPCFDNVFKENFGVVIHDVD